MSASNFNIEYVLPKNPEHGWEQFSDEDVQSMVERIGNMTLLKKKDNTHLGNESYDVKRSIFQQSSFGLTQKLAEDNLQWTPERIAARQSGLAHMASSIWRVDQFSKKISP